MKRKEITKTVHSKFTNWYIHQPANGSPDDKHSILQTTNERAHIITSVGCATLSVKMN